TLADYIRRHGPLSTEDAFAVLWPIARVLQDAHNRGVLHRSLTPWSVLLQPHDPADDEPFPELDLDDLEDEEIETEGDEDEEDGPDPWDILDEGDGAHPEEDFDDEGTEEDDEEIDEDEEDDFEESEPPRRFWDVRL